MKKKRLLPLGILAVLVLAALIYTRPMTLQEIGKVDIAQCESVSGYHRRAPDSEFTSFELSAEDARRSQLIDLFAQQKYRRSLINLLSPDGGSTHQPKDGDFIWDLSFNFGPTDFPDGSTGKGNDQVRFELAIMHFAPDLKIITPWREWDIQSRDEEIDYAEAHHIPLKISRETNYSKDKNLWHLSHEGLDLEDPGNEPQYDKAGFLELGVSPKTAPDKSEFVELEFEKGAPVALNGEKLKPVAIIAKLNEIGGRNGIGLYDVVENRLVGMKSRGVYETPGGTILYKSHEVLETLTLDKLTAHKKRELAITFGELVYDGQWFSPLRKALSAFVTSTQEHVTGKVRLELYKGNLINAGVWSPYSLYREDIATFAAVSDQYLF